MKRNQCYTEVTPIEHYIEDRWDGWRSVPRDALQYTNHQLRRYRVALSHQSLDTDPRTTKEIQANGG